MKVSICIAAFNKPRHLKNTLDSIFCQKVPFLYEVIVVDDGSKDNEVSRVCEEYNIVLHRIERDPVFRNPCASRNVAYKLAQGDIIIAQSDEVIHGGTNTIEQLVFELENNLDTFVIANVFNKERNGIITSEFTGLKRKKPLFFLGAIWRKHLYAVGGNDEDFLICTGYEDAWFADCLINGLSLKPLFTTKVKGYHQWHPNYNDFANEQLSERLYKRKVVDAQSGKIQWWARTGPWPYIEKDDLEQTQIEQIFTNIYRTSHWGQGESSSGAGSSLEATKVIRSQLIPLLVRNGIRSVLDIPCGDYHWMQSVDYGGISYIGADIVAEVIEENKKKYPHIRFEHIDLLRGVLPKADCVFCRDCLVHFSEKDVYRALWNIRRSGTKFLITTTFPSRLRNAIIETGNWTPYNLEISPFNFPRPLESINEDCQEWYPHFNDKSLGLWRVQDLPMRSGIRSIVVCVGYDDFLAITLPRNLAHFDRTLVITSPQDIRTQELCSKFETVQCHTTDVFYKNEAYFNKGAAIEEGFDVLGRSGWFCIWDADIVMPKDIGIVADKDVNCLYSPVRCILPDPKSFSDTLNWETLQSPTKAHEFDGYFQLFSAEAPLAKPWYGINWKHAGGGDSDFQFQFSATRRKRLPFRVLHLGREGIPELRTRTGVNWCGRVSPRIDGQDHLQQTNSSHILKVIQAKKRGDVNQEKIVEKEVTLTGGIPRIMNFFWTGRMSFMRYMSLYSFRKLNPDWKIILNLYAGHPGDKNWVTDEVDDEEYSGEDYLDRIDDLGIERREYTCPVTGLARAQISDIFQWTCLYEQGGYYADMDILWKLPMSIIEGTAKKNPSAIFCLEKGLMAIGFFAAKPGLPMFYDIQNAALNEPSKPHMYQQYGAGIFYSLFAPKSGKWKSRKDKGNVCVENIKLRYPSVNLYVLPDFIIYPYVWTEIDRIFREGNTAVHPNCVGLHWFGGAAISQEWNRKLTEQNWATYTNVFTTCLRELLCTYPFA